MNIHSFCRACACNVSTLHSYAWLSMCLSTEHDPSRPESSTLSEPEPLAPLAEEAGIPEAPE